MMLFNIKDETWHPILYLESPMPGSGQTDFIRYKSKGHRTVGLKDRQEAMGKIQPEMVDRLPNHVFHHEADGDVAWDGEEMPIGVELRPRN